MDYESIDLRRRLLFVAHLGDGAVVVVNLNGPRVATTLEGVDAVHGVLAVPNLDRVYASATGTNQVVAIDERTVHIVARIPAGTYPDGMAYDPVTKRLFVSDERGRTETVIDARTQRRLATIDLGGEAGNTQYDPITRRILVNVQTLGKLVFIDPVRNRIVGEVALPGCQGNHGLLVDPAKRRAFIACEDNAVFLWLDLRTLKIGSAWRVGENPDVLALDSASQRLYVAAESGVVAVFRDGDRVERLGQGFLAPAAHTVAVDPQTRRVYFPLENVAGRPVLRVFEERP